MARRRAKREEKGNGQLETRRGNPPPPPSPFILDAALYAPLYATASMQPPAMKERQATTWRHGGAVGAEPRIRAG